MSSLNVDNALIEKILNVNLLSCNNKSQYLNVNIYV